MLQWSVHCKKTVSTDIRYACRHLLIIFASEIPDFIENPVVKHNIIRAATDCFKNCGVLQVFLNTNVLSQKIVLDASIMYLVGNILNIKMCFKTYEIVFKKIHYNK